MLKKTLVLLSIVCIATCQISSAAKPANTKEAAPVAQPATIECTFAIIKPDAVTGKNSGQIIDLIEKNKFTIVGMKKVQLTRKQAERFYAEHKGKPFFADLVAYMTSGPIIALALEKVNAIKEWRELMGATNPEKAAPGTLRRMFGSSITQNATHGSDSPKSAQAELNFFFPQL